MKIQFIGVMHMKGIGKTGNEYDFARISYGVPVETVMQEKRQVHGYGAEVMNLPMDAGAIGQFAHCQTGDVIDISVSPDPRNLQKNICTGLHE